MEFVDGKLLRIFIDQRARSGMQPAYTAIVELLRKRGMKGASVFRGIEGSSAHAPVIIEVVDDEAAIERILPEIEARMTEGTVTIEAARYARRAR